MTITAYILLMGFGYGNNSTNDGEVFVISQILLAFYEVSATRDPVLIRALVSIIVGLTEDIIRLGECC